jgi:hypothetical protein
MPHDHKYIIADDEAVQRCFLIRCWVEELDRNAGKSS